MANIFGFRHSFTHQREKKEKEKEQRQNSENKYKFEALGPWDVNKVKLLQHLY